MRKHGMRGALLTTKSLVPIESYLLKDDSGQATQLPQPTERFFSYGSQCVFPMEGNDVLGDCTIAGWIHCAQVAASIAHITYAVPTTAEAESTYTGMTGGPDTGLELTQVIAAGKASGGLLGMSIVGVGQVDITNVPLLRAALWNFGFLYLAVNLPASAETDFDQNEPWRLPAPPDAPIGGHCIVTNGCAPNIDPNTYPGTRLFDIITWGASTECDADWWLQYGAAAYVLIPQWYIDAGIDAVGLLDLDTMATDLSEV